MKALNHNQIIWILVVLIAITTMLCSCTAGKMHKSGIYIRSTDVIEWDTLYPIAKYDSCRLLKRKFLESYSTLIYLQGTTCVIEGKKCEFKVNEMLYYKAEKWYPPDFSGSHCKYFISNEDESIKYPKL